MDHKDTERLFYATENNDVITLRRLLADGLSPNALFSGGNAITCNFWTPLHSCAEKGSYECVEALLDAGADPNYPDYNGQTPLFSSITTEWIHVTQLLLQRGACATVSDKKGRTCFHVATLTQDVRLLQLCIDAHQDKADLNMSDIQGWTPLITAVSRDGCVDHVKLLLSQSEVNIHAENYGRGRCVLQEAVARLRTDILPVLDLLLKAGADVHHMDKQGYSAYSIIPRRVYEDTRKGKMNKALMVDLLRAAHILYQHGYDVNRVPVYAPNVVIRSTFITGSCLHAAVDFDCADVIEKLVQEHGADTERLNFQGETPLLLAVRKGQINALCCLLRLQHINCLTCHNQTGQSRLSKQFGSHQITPDMFRVALLQKHVRVICFFVDCGYDVINGGHHTERTMCLYSLFDENMRDWMTRCTARPLALRDWCERVVRLHLWPDLAGKSVALPLPRAIQQRISLRNVV